MGRIFARCFLTLTRAPTLVTLSGGGPAPQPVSAQSDTITNIRDASNRLLSTRVQ
jgi:hypothetical protein